MGNNGGDGGREGGREGGRIREAGETAMLQSVSCPQWLAADGSYTNKPSTASRLFVTTTSNTGKVITAKISKIFDRHELSLCRTRHTRAILP